MRNLFCAESGAAKFVAGAPASELEAGALHPLPRLPPILVLRGSEKPSAGPAKENRSRNSKIGGSGGSGGCRARQLTWTCQSCKGKNCKTQCLQNVAPWDFEIDFSLISPGCGILYNGIYIYIYIQCASAVPATVPARV